MATSGSFNTTSREGRYLTFSWSVKSQDTANNKTTIYWSLTGGGTSGYVYCSDFEVTIDGTKVYSSDTRREVWTTTTIASGTRTITHSADGTKTLTASVKASIYTYVQDRTGSGSWALPTIARTPTVTVSNTAKTETSATMKWSSNLTINRVRYRTSTNSGSSWSSWTSKTVSAKSGSYTVSGLAANTSYTIQTELRSSESGLTNTANKTVKTYAWPYPLGTDQYVYRDGKLDIDFKNPLERNVSYVIKVGDTILDQGETDGLGVTLWDIAEDMLPLIPNSNTGTYTVTVTYSGHTATATGTFYATGANPTITSVAYQDSNNTAQAIIQDNQKILQNVSDPMITATGAGLFGATLASGSIEILGQTNQMVKMSDTAVAGVGGTINSATDVTAKVTVTDSRGNSSSQTITITMLAYTSPSAIITLQRENNFYSETDLTVDADVMHTGSNVPTITARYREHPSGAWQNWPQITDNVTSTEILNNTKEWDVEVTVTDSFGGSTTYTGLFVGIGLPIFYIDRGMRAVSINSFPEAGQTFVVNGVDILGALKPKLIEPTALSVPGVTFGSFYVYQSAGVCMITLEFALSGAMSSWTPIATGLPAPATASLQSPVGWFDTATGWDTSYKRPTRVQITATGELRIRYGADGNYRISFSYPINA